MRELEDLNYIRDQQDIA